jgi:hypothetical protein
MSILDRNLTRREALQAGLVSAAGLYLACGAGSGSSNAATLNWITWNDHYLDDQLKAVNNNIQLGARVTLESDDNDGYVKIKSTKGQFDIVSTDAMWVPKFHSDGLIDSFDMSAIAASSQLYLPLWMVNHSDLLQPCLRVAGAYVVAGSDRLEVQRQDRGREPTNRPDGDGRPRHGREDPLWDDDG